MVERRLPLRFGSVNLGELGFRVARLLYVLPVTYLSMLAHLLELSLELHQSFAWIMGNQAMRTDGIGRTAPWRERRRDATPA